MGGLADDDSLFIEVNRGTMTAKKISEPISKYIVSSSYVYRIPSVSEYISTPSPLEINMCKESF